MSEGSQTRSVKIGADERGGWTSDRPRRGGPERPPDVSVRGRVLRPADRLRYAPGSLLVVVSGAAQERDRFIGRVLEGSGSALTLDKVRRLLEGKVASEAVDAKAVELLEATIAKRLENGDSVVVGAEGVSAEERERYVRLAHRFRRPRHLILLEVPRDQVPEESREELNRLRTALDAGRLGAEGFHTAMRLGGGSASEVKRIVFRPEPRDE